MIVVGIDPGTSKSAVVVWDGKHVRDHQYLENMDMLGYLDKCKRMYRAPGEGVPHLAVEWIQNYGMEIGQSTVVTIFWTGRFWERWGDTLTSHQVLRKEVCSNLCHSGRAKDKNIRRALIDRFGGDEVAIGGKKCQNCKGKGWSGVGRPTCKECGGTGYEHPPGIFSGISQHKWAALGVAVTLADEHARIQSHRS